MSKRSAAGLVRYVKFLVEAGVMDRPVWLDVLERWVILSLNIHKVYKTVTLSNAPSAAYRHRHSPKQVNARQR